MTMDKVPVSRRGGRAGNATGSAQEQLNLKVSPISANSQTGENAAAEVLFASDVSVQQAFVPSNRERLLRQLSALVLSPDFPPEARIPVDLREQVLLLHDGLRSAEVDMLADGRVQRFPVLAEISSAAISHGPTAFGIADVLALHFRNEEEASNFRFRPVDELDTAHIPCLLSPSLFGFDGPSRLASIASDTSPQRLRNAISADRIAGAVCCLLKLAAVEPECRQAVGELLSERSGLQWLSAAGESHVAEAHDDSGGAVGAIIRAFVEHDVGSPSQLVQALGGYLSEVVDSEVSRAIPRWLETADAVLSNRMILDGEILSDNGSIPLRAAILAVVVDDVSDLPAFLYAERPAGGRVVVCAAFLIGLKIGIANLPWRTKLPHLDLLSSLLVALHQPDPAARRQALDAFEIEPDESVSPFQLALYWRDRLILRWPPLPRPDVAPLDNGGEMAAISESTVESKEPEVNRTIAGPGGRIIEIFAPVAGMEMTSLRVLLGETDRLRKAKEILEIASNQALCWRVGVTAEGGGALHLDIPGTLSTAILDAMSLRLVEALALYLVPVKPEKRSRAKKMPKTPTAGEIS